VNANKREWEEVFEEFNKNEPKEALIVFTEIEMMDRGAFVFIRLHSHH
jgi:hypothetical protein